MSALFLLIFLASEIYLAWTLIALEEVLLLQIQLLGTLPIVVLLSPFYLRGELHSGNRFNFLMKLTLAISLLVLAFPLFQLIDVWEVKDSWQITGEHIFTRRESLWLLLSALMTQTIVFGVLLTRRLQ